MWRSGTLYTKLPFHISIPQYVISGCLEDCFLLISVIKAFSVRGNKSALLQLGWIKAQRYTPTVYGILISSNIRPGKHRYCVCIVCPPQPRHWVWQHKPEPKAFKRKLQTDLQTEWTEWIEWTLRTLLLSSCDLCLSSKELIQHLLQKRHSHIPMMSFPKSTSWKQKT